jgi:hypothetical protein
MGATAIDLLISRIERNETGIPTVPLTLSINATWNPGQTLRALSAAGHPAVRRGELRR